MPCFKSISLLFTKAATEFFKVSLDAIFSEFEYRSKLNESRKSLCLSQRDFSDFKCLP